MPTIYDPITDIPLWPGEPPLRSAADIAMKYPEQTLENDPAVAKIVNVSEPTLSFYPASARGARPCVLVIPGGGYNILAWTHEGLDVVHWLLSFGFCAALLKYRVPERRDQALADARRAMRTIRARAAEWNVDPGRVGAIGFSAGGHIVARLCCARDPELPAADAVDRESAKPDFALPIYPAYVDAPGGGTDPDLRIEKDFPPSFIAVSRDDPFAASAFALALALRAADVPFEMHVFESGGHGWGVPCAGAVQGRWTGLARDWLLRGAGRAAAQGA